MQPDETFFTPDGIEDQIESQLGKASDATPNGRLVHDLHAQYLGEGDATATLARTWARIQGQVSKQSSQPTIIVPKQGVVTVTNHHHDVDILSPAHAVAARDARPEPPRRPWVGALAAILIVALGATVFALRPNGHSMEKGGTAATATPFAPKIWAHITQLDYATPNIDTIPAIAPSNPDVIYEAYLSIDKVTTLFHRTDDGGKTWHEVSLPVPGTSSNLFYSFVSPLDPRTVFMTVLERDKQYCPADRQMDSTIGGIVCFLQYLTTDGGAHWELLHLPLAGTFQYAILGAPQNVRAQGKRLYMAFGCNDFTLCTYIITSTDGGTTWEIADATIHASGQDICDFSVTPVGSTIIAFAGTTCTPNAQPAAIHLWQSDNAGTTWHDNGPVTTPIIQGSALAESSDSTRPLIYADLPTITSTTKDKTGEPFYNYSAAPTDVKATADGGQTWQSAPNVGFPPNTVVVRVSAVLPNGAVLVETAPVGNPTDLSGSNQGVKYVTWKAGEGSWHQFGDTLDVRPMSIIITTPAAPQWHVWLAGVKALHVLTMQVFKI